MIYGNMQKEAVPFETASFALAKKLIVNLPPFQALYKLLAVF